MAQQAGDFLGFQDGRTTGPRPRPATKRWIHYNLQMVCGMSGETETFHYVEESPNQYRCEPHGHIQNGGGAG